MSTTQQPTYTTGKEQQGPTVRTDTRGASVRSATQTGERAVERSKELVGNGSTVDYIKNTYGPFAAEAVNEVATQNVQFYPQFGGNADTFAEAIIGPNWLSRVNAFNEFVGQYGLQDVTEETDQKTLQHSAWFGISETGTVYLFGPGVVFGQGERENFLAKEDGLFARLFIEGRRGGIELPDGKVASQISAINPNNNARVLTFAAEEIIDEDTQEVIETKWNRTVPDLPLEGHMLSLSSHTPGGRKEGSDTHAMMRVVYTTNPGNVRELFAAFGEAVGVIDRKTLRVGTARLQESTGEDTPGAGSRRARGVTQIR